MSRELAFHTEDGEPVYRYPNGDLRRANGHWFQRGKTPQPLFDSAGSALANAGKALLKQQRVETLQGEARRLLTKQAKTATAEQAGAKLVEDIYKTARHKTTKPRDKVACADFVLKHAGMQAKEQAGGPTLTLQMTPEAIDRMYALSMGVPAIEDVVEGVVVEDAEADSQ